MKPRILLVTILTLLLVLLSLPSHAMVPVTCFNHEFIRGKGKPFTESYSFPGISGSATIRLTNNKISSATVSVNGEAVFGPSDFNQNVTYLEATVTLNEGNINTIGVTLKSKPGGTILVSIEQLVDADAAAFVGSFGGEIVAPDGSSIAVPPNAVDELTLFSITQLTEYMLPEPLPGETGFVGGLDIKPDGIFPNYPITVKIKPIDPNLQPGTLIPIWTYSSLQPQYTYEGWKGIVDDQGYFICHDVTHLTGIFGINLNTPKQQKYKDHFKEVLRKLLEYRNDVCSYRKGFFSFGDPAKLNNYINKNYILLGLRIDIDLDNPPSAWP